MQSDRLEEKQSPYIEFYIHKDGL